MRIKNLPSIESMDGSQDALVIEQTDGSEDKSRKVSPAQIKQYVLGNSIDDIYSVMGQMGAKNLIPYPYYNESGFSDQGLTVTYDADGVFTINKVAGTATAYYRIATLNFLKPSTKYRLVFEVENATSISIFLQKPTSGDYVTINNKSSGLFVADFETTADSQISTRSIGLSCTASDTETNATVKVMLMLASDTDETYQPYAMTNKQLTEVIGDLSQTGLTGDNVAEQLTTAKNQIAGLENIKVANVSATMTVSTADNLAIGGYRSVSSTSKALSSFTGYPTGKTKVAEILYAYGANAALLGVVHVINGTVYLNTAATGDYTVHGVVFYKD